MDPSEPVRSRRAASASWRFAAALLVLSGSTPAAEAAVEAEAEEERSEALLLAVRSQMEASRDEPSVLSGLDLASAAVRETVRAIRATRVDLALDRQPIDDVLELLRGASGLPFVVSARARKALEAERPEVTLALRDIPLESCLNLLALHLGEYRFTVRYGAVVLIRKDEHRPRTTLRVYPVRDIVRRPPDFPAPTLALEPASRAR